MGAIQSITAAASRILSGGKGGKSMTANSGNAAIAWDLWATVPEVSAYASYISGGMSGATLFAGKRGPDGTVEAAPAGSRAQQLVEAIAGGPDGQAELLADFGSQLSVTGDSLVVILPNAQADSYADDRWVVLSTDEFTVQRGKIRAQIEGREVEIPEYDPDVPQDPDAPVAFRVWQHSPRKRLEATSPVIRSVAILEELRLLSATVAAIARSRITGRGVLLVPAGARFPSTPGQESSEDSLLDTFIEVASTAIKEPESAAATVPIVLEVPGDLINGVKWLEFASQFDSLAIQLRDEAIRRFATGADIPAEVLLGLGDMNHWGAWAVSAEAIRFGVEPRLALVCHAITTQWLRPLLEGEPDADEWMVWYDTSSLRSSSNKAASALEAFKLGLVSDEAARRELGFTEADAPSLDDATVAPETDDAAEGGLPVNETQEAPAKDQVSPELRLAATVFTGPKDSGTLQGLDSYGALVAAVDGLVWAALTGAGQKLRQTPAVPRSARTDARMLASAEVHTRHPVSEPGQVDAWRLLDGAWDRVPEVAARYGMNPDLLTAALDAYTRVLLASGQEHEFDNVPRLLTQIRITESRDVA